MLEIVLALALIAAIGWLFAGRRGAQIAIGTTIGVTLTSVLLLVIVLRHKEKRTEKQITAQPQQRCEELRRTLKLPKGYEHSTVTTENGTTCTF